MELLDSRLDGADSLVEEVVGLRGTVEDLTKQVETLAQIVDDLRSDFEWALHRDQHPSITAGQPLTSMPKDPLANDFAERVNSFSGADFPVALRKPDQDVSEGQPHQSSLF